MTLRLADYTSPVTASYGKEVDEAIHVCFYCIDNPPEEYRIVRQAIQGLVHLGKYRPTLRPIVMLKLLQVINSPQVYRSHPRRFAVRDMGHLAVSDETLVVPCADLLIQMVEKKNENSQYVRKGAFCALSRIGRKFPTLHEKLVPLFLSHYRDPSVKSGVKWGILIGLGRMAQTSAALRREACPVWFEAAQSPVFRLRWAAIKGMCHACCPAGDVERDLDFEEKCFELGVELFHQTLPTGGANRATKKQKKKEGDREEAHLVQYGVMQGFGLLLRASINTWWPRLSSIFAEALVDPQVASIVKASVMLNLGKASYYMKESDPYYGPIRDILWELSGYENIFVSEPASYALANMALGHSNMYVQVKSLLLEKFRPAQCLSDASENALRYYLKTWCKFISYSYVPVLSDCSRVVCSSTQEKISRDELEQLQSSVQASLSTPAPKPSKPPPSQKSDFLSPQFRKQINPDTLASEEVQSDSEDEEEVNPPPRPHANSAGDRSAIARDSARLYTLCSHYSASVVESILLLLKDPELLDDGPFLTNLGSLIKRYRSNGDVNPILDESELQTQFDELDKLNTVLKENVVEILLHPENMETHLWSSNLKRVAEQSAGMAPTPTPSTPAPSKNTNTNTDASPSGPAAAQKEEESPKESKKETASAPTEKKSPTKKAPSPSHEKPAAGEASPTSPPSSTSSSGATTPAASSTSTSTATTKAPQTTTSPASAPASAAGTVAAPAESGAAATRKDFVPVKAPPRDESRPSRNKKSKESRSTRKRERDMDDDDEEDEEDLDTPDTKAQKRTKDDAPHRRLSSEKGPGKGNKNLSAADKKGDKDVDGRDARSLPGKSQVKAPEPKKKKKQACAFYLAGRCNKGDRCAFQHTNDQLASCTLCRFFKDGNCRHGSSCRFSHDWKTEMCPRGKGCNVRGCRYSHDEIEVVKAGLRNRRPGERLPSDRVDDRRPDRPNDRRHDDPPRGPTDPRRPNNDRRPDDRRPSADRRPDHRRPHEERRYDDRRHDDRRPDDRRPTDPRRPDDRRSEDRPRRDSSMRDWERPKSAGNSSPPSAANYQGPPPASRGQPSHQQQQPQHQYNPRSGAVHPSAASWDQGPQAQRQQQQQQQQHQPAYSYSYQQPSHQAPPNMHYQQAPQMTYDPAVNYYAPPAAAAHQTYDPAAPVNQLPLYQTNQNQWGQQAPASAPYYPGSAPPSYPPTSSHPSGPNYSQYYPR